MLLLVATNVADIYDVAADRNAAREIFSALFSASLDVEDEPMLKFPASARPDVAPHVYAPLAQTARFAASQRVVVR